MSAPVPTPAPSRGGGGPGAPADEILSGFDAATLDVQIRMLAELDARLRAELDAEGER